MQTFNWEHPDVVHPDRRESFLFTYKVGREIRDALVETGGTMDWSSHLYSGADGAWRLPAMDEYGHTGYLHHLQGASANDGPVRSTMRCPHGWATALEAGLMLNHGDKVRIELTSFDSVRHLLEGWVTRAAGTPGASRTSYSAIAHLSKSQGFDTDITRGQLHALVSDPDAVPPTNPDAEIDAQIEAELKALHQEYRERAGEIFARHGRDPHPFFGFGR